MAYNGYSPRIKTESVDGEDVEMKREMDVAIKKERNSLSPSPTIKAEEGTHHHHQLKKEHSTPSPPPPPSSSPSPPPPPPKLDYCRRCNSSTHYNPIYCTEQSADGRCRFCNSTGHMKRSCPRYVGFGNKSFIFNYLFESPNTTRGPSTDEEMARAIHIRLFSAGAEQDIHHLFRGFESEIVPHFQLYELGERCTYWKVVAKSKERFEKFEWAVVKRAIEEIDGKKLNIKLPTELK